MSLNVLLHSQLTGSMSGQLSSWSDIGWKICNYNLIIMLTVIIMQQLTFCIHPLFYPVIQEHICNIIKTTITTKSEESMHCRYILFYMWAIYIYSVKRPQAIYMLFTSDHTSKWYSYIRIMALHAFINVQNWAFNWN